MKIWLWLRWCRILLIKIDLYPLPLTATMVTVLTEINIHVLKASPQVLYFAFDLFSRQVSANTQCKISKKSFHWEWDCTMRKDGWTDRQRWGNSQSLFATWWTRLTRFVNKWLWINFSSSYFLPWVIYSKLLNTFST